MSDATEVLTVQEGQAAVKQVAVSGEIISLPSATDVKAIVQTDKGPVAAVKTVSLGGGGASGNFVEQLSTMPEASTKQGKIVQYVGTEPGTYNHGAFYESVEQAGGTNSYSGFESYRDVALEDTDTAFTFINTCLARNNQPQLTVGDFVKVAIEITDDIPTAFYIEITPSGGVATRTDVDLEWLFTNYATPEEMGISFSGSTDYCTFTVTGVEGTVSVWQEITVDVALEAMVENNASVLSTTTALNPSKGGSKSVTLSTITAFGSLDSRPSHKVPGAIVIDDTQNRIGIITDVNTRSATVVTVFTGLTGTVIPTTGAGPYKFVGSTASSTATWVEGLVVGDIYANLQMSGSNYFGGRPFMSKTGANDTTKFQSYTVIEKNIPSTYTLTSDSSEGKVTITDATALYTKINDLFSQGVGYGSITELRPGLNIMLGLYAEDYYGTGAFQFSLSTLEISDPVTMDSWSGNMVYIGSESSLTDEWGLASTLEGNTSGNIQITVGTIGGNGYQYESQGCAKVQAATEADPTYVFSMPGNMVQMGGIVDLPSMGPGVAVENTPVTLPEELANANYVVQLTVITDSGFQQVVVDASNRTTTGFDICARNNDSAETVTGAKAAWTVVGVIPMALYSGQA